MQVLLPLSTLVANEACGLNARQAGRKADICGTLRKRLEGKA